MNIEKKYIIWIALILGILLIWYVFTKVPLSEVIDLLKNTTLQLILLFILTIFMLQMVLTYRWKIVLESQGIKHGFWKLNNYRMAGYCVGYLTPSALLGGEPVRAALLSEKANVPFEKSLSGVVIDKTIELSSSAIFFTVGVLILLINFVVTPQLEFALIGAVVVFLILVFSFNIRMFQGKKFFHPIIRFLGLLKIKKIKKLEQKIINFEKLTLKFFKRDKKHFFYVILFSFLSWILMFIEYSIIGRMLGEHLSLMQIFLIISVVGLAYLIPIPMALGALEVGQVSIFNAISVSAAAGLALALVVRIKDVILASIGLIILFVYGLDFKAFKNSKISDEDRKRIIKKI